MTALIENIWKDSLAPYGAYDCVHNATALWLTLQDMPLQPFHQFNWHIYYDRKTDVFGGNLPKRDVLRFLDRVYGIHIEEKTSFELPDKKWVLIGLNSYYLPYIKELYNMEEQNHYVLARSSGENIVIYDHYYKYHGRLSIEECHKYWRKFHTSISVLDVPKSNIPILSKIVPPIVKEDMNEVYSRAENEILSQINELEQGQEQLKDNLRMKRYFGCIRSIALNRDKHFEAAHIESDYKKRIQYAWNSLLREFFVISSESQKNYCKVKHLLSEVLHIEKEYLAKLKGV